MRLHHLRSLTVGLVGLLALCAQAADAPREGRYQCVTTSSQTTIGWVWILPGQGYKNAEKGREGKFGYDPASHEITWNSGVYTDYGWRGWYLPPGLKDEVRSERSKDRDAILIVDKAKAAAFGSTPFQNSRKVDREWIRCYWQKP